MIRKLLTCCLLAIFFSTSVVGNLAWAQSLPAEVVITAKRLNVRDDVGGTKLGAVLRGQQFQLKGTKENWGKIEFEPGRLGWISLQYTQPVVQNRSVLEERAVRPVAAKSETVDLSDKRQALVKEIIQLEWNAVDLKEGFVRLRAEQTKTNEARIVQLSRYFRCSRRYP